MIDLLSSETDNKTQTPYGNIIHFKHGFKIK